MSKEDRREQLIKATIKCIANKGLSGTTMADVTGEAGLSLGIVNLHFQSKEKLLIETLRYVTDEYNQGQARIMAGHGDTAAKIKELVEFDFSARICQKNKLAVWFAFWGESRSRPTYQSICSHSDIETETAITELYQQAINEQGYQDVDVDLVSTGYTALCDGLWLDLLLTPALLSREKAKMIAYNYLSSFFPRHI
ncbi:TetR family transcriptional regulator [Oceanicoccus sagamiensis]|uniref:TetR family transcriptional regulator n=2 Tax=Oceanicoccus sagamiensis TaxID=716816 RepID=A0A1X9NJH2_9GAMM|nr:TetR family transcriptional regulator [Oceanicoccus sagamiensis]